MAAGAPRPPVVLLAEDQALVRLCAADILVEDGGYKVLEAGSADEALSIFQAHPDVSVLVADIEMPGRLNGLTLARHAAAARPGIGIVITSGRHLPNHSEMPPGTHFLAKPSSPNQLLDAVRAVLPPEAGTEPAAAPAASIGPDLAPLTRAFAEPALGIQPAAEPAEE